MTPIALAAPSTFPSAARARSLVLWLIGFALLACSTLAFAQTSRLDTIVKRDKLVVSVMSTSAPNGFVDDNGQLTGFEVEFARLIAKAMLGDPQKVEFLVTTPDGRFPAVLSGKSDFGIASATIYPDRAMRLAFTRPYMDAGTAVVVKANSPIKKIADLNDPKQTLVSANSTAMVERAKRYAAQATHLFFEGDSVATMALRNGRGTAYQADVAIANWFVAQSKGEFVKLPGLLGDVNGNAVFMKPGDFQLWLAVDTIVGEYVSGSRYSEFSALYKKWFGTAPPPQRAYTVQ